MKKYRALGPCAVSWLPHRIRSTGSFCAALEYIRSRLNIITASRHNSPLQNSPLLFVPAAAPSCQHDSTPTTPISIQVSSLLAPSTYTTDKPITRRQFNTTNSPLPNSPIPFCLRPLRVRSSSQYLLAPRLNGQGQQQPLDSPLKVRHVTPFHSSSTSADFCVQQWRQALPVHGQDREARRQRRPFA